jgi:hypothetical protein
LRRLRQIEGLSHELGVGVHHGRVELQRDLSKGFDIADAVALLLEKKAEAERNKTLSGKTCHGSYIEMHHLRTSFFTCLV